MLIHQVFEKAKTKTSLRDSSLVSTLFLPEKELKKYFYINQIPAKTCYNRT